MVSYFHQLIITDYPLNDNFSEELDSLLFYNGAEWNLFNSRDPDTKTVLPRNSKIWLKMIFENWNQQISSILILFSWLIFDNISHDNVLIRLIINLNEWNVLIPVFIWSCVHEMCGWARSWTTHLECDKERVIPNSIWKRECFEMAWSGIVFFQKFWIGHANDRGRPSSAQVLSIFWFSSNLAITS